MDRVLRLFASVHEHFVKEDECGKPILARHLKQPFKRQVARWGVAFFVLFIGAQDSQAVGASDLKGDDAPRVFQHALLTGRTEHRDTKLGVQFIETNSCYTRLWRMTSHGA